MPGFQILSVSQLNFFVKSVLEGQPQLREVYVRGELSNFTRNAASGHCYFTLKDEAAGVRCVLFRRNADQLIFRPESGMKVIARGSATLYERDGGFQLVVQDLQPDGLGAVYLAVQQLRARLEAEGLFDPAHKRPVPAYPRRVGVVTSPQAAAYTDITTVLARRWPSAQVVLSPAPVQGRGAAQQMARALRLLDSSGGCDVIILARGGGSAEDLWEFNSEELARAVYACRTPVISAVGHERDVSLCDWCADLRAPTPSAAAELAVPDRAAEQRRLDDLAAALRQRILFHYSAYMQRLDGEKTQIYALNPEKILKENRQSFAHLVQLFQMTSAHLLEQKRGRLSLLAQRLNGRNPLEILSLGYSVTLGPQNAPLRSASGLQPGDRLTTRLADGTVDSAVTRVQKDGE